MRIVILSGGHLCHNPRVIKEASALAAVGFEVEVLGAATDASLAARDRQLQRDGRFSFTPVVDATAADPLKQLAWEMSRVRNKVGQLSHRSFRFENRWQLGNALGALRRDALRRNVDLYIAHSEAASAVAGDLMRRDLPVGIDMEDWFSEDLLPQARRNRPIALLRRLEAELLTKGVFASCPSRAMSRALAEEFGCRPPAVVYNAFPWAEREFLDGRVKDRVNQGQPSIHWFSQTIGPGRGLEDLLAALPFLKHPAAIDLRGHPVAGFGKWLAERTPEGWRNRIFLHEVVSNGELLSRIAEHDIGFAGEQKYCRNRDLTVSNKILQYLLAGLAVVASDTAGQREVAEQTGEAVLLYPSGDAAALAAQLDALLGDPERLARAKAAALQAAKRTFCWERQEPVLLEGVARALCAPRMAGS